MSANNDETKEVEDKKFSIFDQNRPKVLFLGNGIHRAFSKTSWNDVLDSIKGQNFTYSAWQYDMPMSLKASLLSNNQLGDKIKQVINNTNNEVWNSLTSITDPDESKLIEKYARLGFDYIITTNYSYEVECSLLNKGNVSSKDILKLQNYNEINRAENKFLIHTFNKIKGYPPIWHIHGEARKPNSIIIGQLNYGKLLSKYIERLNNENTWYNNVIKNFNNKQPQKIGSWLDAFVLGDVYIVGFGFDFSETDLWWLLEYKSNFIHKGNTYFFEPADKKTNTCFFDSAITCSKLPTIVSKSECKIELLKTYGTTVISKVNNNSYFTNCNYKNFYNDAYDHIKSII